MGGFFKAGLSRSPEYRTPQRVAYAKATAALRGDQPFGLSPADGGKWKQAPDPTTFALFNGDTTGAYRAGLAGPYADPNYYIDNAQEAEFVRNKAIPYMNKRMGMGSFKGPDGRMIQGRMGRSMAAYRRLGMNPPPMTRNASEVAGLVESGLFKPNEQVGRFGMGMVGQLRDFDAGHTAYANIHKGIDAKNELIHRWQREQGLSENQLPTNFEFWDKYVKPTLDRRAEWDAEHPAPRTPSGGRTSTNPYSGMPWIESFNAWGPHVAEHNQSADEIAAKLAKGGEYEWMGRYRPGHEDDPTMHESLRRLGLLPGMTPTAEGARVLAIVNQGNSSGGVY